MAKPLTARAVEQAKPEGRVREIPDGGLPGLYLVIQPSGTRSFTLRYRHIGRTRNMTLGRWPAFSLGEARDAARTALRAIEEGRDPAGEKRHTKTDSSTLCLEVARLFIERDQRPTNRTWKETARLLGLRPDDAHYTLIKGGIIDQWSGRRIEEIRRRDVIAVLDALSEKPATKQNTFAALRRLFNWALARDLIAISPCAGVEAPSPSPARERILTDDEMCWFWYACDAVGPPFAPLFRLLCLTGQRREEVGGMRWGELDGNLWTIPAERVKNGREHSLNLPLSTLAIIKGIPRIQNCSFVFSTTGKTPVSGYSEAKRRLDSAMLKLAQRETARADVQIPPWRLHDLRRTAASGMAKLGIGLPAIEKVLNHVSGSFGGIVGVYQRHEFKAEKAIALEAWNGHVMSLVRAASSKDTSRPLRR
ncbi:site-specific integrase [Methylobacterium sp. V23]|uniref:tyrosine-type recombinase/integrase n=1 Tax=Methylobacterium sp. V23 TaxID=2044878 RepID=UPI000CDBA57F|nr:site-specific integrase [Methylobacterium sp. V23]POR41171.1 integrase [Methylobacterium sp. V23]